MYPDQQSESRRSKRIIVYVCLVAAGGLLLLLSLTFFVIWQVGGQASHTDAIAGELGLENCQQDHPLADNEHLKEAAVKAIAGCDYASAVEGAAAYDFSLSVAQYATSSKETHQELFTSTCWGFFGWSGDQPLVFIGIEADTRIIPRSVGADIGKEIIASLQDYDFYPPPDRCYEISESSPGAASETDQAEAASESTDAALSADEKVIPASDPMLEPSADEKVIPASDPMLEPSAELEPQRVEDPTFRLLIPALEVDAVVYDQLDAREDSEDFDDFERRVQQALLQGVLHYPTSYLPGQAGDNFNSNIVIIGHSSGISRAGDTDTTRKYKFIFAELNRLDVGDVIQINHEQKQYVYTIYRREIVDPNEVEVLRSGSDNPFLKENGSLTLITCEPPGTIRKRLVLLAEQTLPSPSENTRVKAGSTTGGDAEDFVPGQTPRYID